MSYYDDDSSINSDENSSFTYDDDDDDSSEFTEHQDLDDTFKTSFGTGTFEANEQQQGKEDMKMINVDGSRKDKATADNTCINPTESLSEGNCLDQDVGRSPIGYSEGSKLEMAKSRVGIVGESSRRFLEMAKTRVGIVGESSGRFLEMAKTRVNTVVESNGGYLEMAKTSVVVGSAVIAVGWSLYRILSSDSSPSPFPSSSENEKKKMMKAPGKIGEYIVREPFEDNPREYFRQLHNSKRQLPSRMNAL